MTNASELFCNRRHRVRRCGIELGLDSSVDSLSHHDGNLNRRRHLHHYRHGVGRDRVAVDGCDSRRRSRPTVGRLSHLERELVRPDQRGSQVPSAIVNTIEDFRSIAGGQNHGDNDRLPGAVLLARERLLERLRAFSVSQNRQLHLYSSSIQHDDFTLGGNNNSSIENEAFLGSQETSKQRPGLTADDLNRLHVQIFRDDEKDEAPSTKDCSICLEGFLNGDQLVILACTHRFHSLCLKPWVRSCGDCPNCRTGIEVTSYK